MKLKSLEIRRTEAYQTPANTLVGTVNLIDAGGGALSVVLSSSSIIAICNLLQEEVARNAKAQAGLAAYALSDARDELLLESHPLLSVDPTTSDEI